MSIREMLTEWQNEILNTDLQPGRASEILVKISALMGNIVDECTHREMEYNKKVVESFGEEEKANRAEIRAKITDEYRSFIEAKGALLVATKMSSALNRLLRAKEQEWISSKHQ